MVQDFVDKEMMELVEKAAEARGDCFVPREFIVKALCKIERGEVEVERYSMTGAPSLKGVYNLALELWQEKQAKDN